MRNMFFHYIFIVFLMFLYLRCVFSLTPPCAPNSLTRHTPQMKNNIIGICYTISVIPSSLTKCIVKLLLFILTFVSALYLCLTKCYLSIRSGIRKGGGGKNVNVFFLLFNFSRGGPAQKITEKMIFPTKKVA